MKHLSAPNIMTIKGSSKNLNPKDTQSSKQLLSLNWNLEIMIDHDRTEIGRSKRAACMAPPLLLCNLRGLGGFHWRPHFPGTRKYVESSCHGHLYKS